MKTNLYPVFFQYFQVIAKIGGALILGAAFASFAYADELDERVEHLQKAASTAYEKMMQTKQVAENSAKDAASAEKKLQSLKQKLTVAEQEYESAKKKSDLAKLSFENATAQWKQASDTLSTEWNRSR